MSKRKNDDKYEKIFKKIKKLERQLRRHRRSRSSSDSSRSSDNRSQEQSHEAFIEEYEIADNNVAELLDADTELEIGTCVELDDVDVATTVECDTEPTAPVATTSSAEPSTSAATIDSMSEVIPCVEPECVEAISDCVILEILGEDPTISNSYGTEIHKDLAVRLEHCTTNGLTKERRKELLEKYLVPINCKLISAPELNAEIKAAMTDMTIRRDKNIEHRQKQMSTAISCIGQGINKIISSNNADPELTKMLMDSQRILCDLQYNDSVIRRNFILSSLKKEMKDQLQNTKPDNLLFGQNLSETIKTAKAISKSGAELKTPSTKPQLSNKKPPAPSNTSRNLNWKGPNARKQPNHPRAKGPFANNQPSSSSKQSRYQPATRGRR